MNPSKYSHFLLAFSVIISTDFLYANSEFVSMKFLDFLDSSEITRISVNNNDDDDDGGGVVGETAKV